VIEAYLERWGCQLRSQFEACLIQRTIRSFGSRLAKFNVPRVMRPLIGVSRQNGTVRSAISTR
jgi:hypothetical protein